MKTCHRERSEAIPVNRIASSALLPRNGQLHQSSVRYYLAARGRACPPPFGEVAFNSLPEGNNIEREKRNLITAQFEKNFPKSGKLRDGSILELRTMKKKDKKVVLSFFSGIPSDEREYARINFLEIEELEGNWYKKVEEGKSVTLLGFIGENLVGVASLNQDLAKGSEHVGYIRLTVAPNYRGRGIATDLSQEIYSIALGSNLEKICAEVVGNQKRSLELFSKKLGFREEAVLADQIKDEKGNKFDLVIRSSDPGRLANEIRKTSDFEVFNSVE